MKKTCGLKHGLRKTGKILILILIPLGVVFISLFCGRFGVTPDEVLQSLYVSATQIIGKVLEAIFPGNLFHYMAMNQNQQLVSMESYTVVTQLRLPRAIAAAAVGAGLAASGGAYQGVFRNPLVNSSLLGVSNGAGFGAALAIIMFGAVGGYTYVFAFVFGSLAVALSYWIARIYKTVPTVMLILGGVIVSSIFSALITLLKYMADVQNELPAIVYWLMGSVASVSYKNFWALIPIAAGIMVLLLFSWKMNVLSMGEKEAYTMGVDVNKSKIIIIAAATLATAGAVCLAGVVGWVGLVIPHIARMVVGNDNRKMLPVAVSVGAAFMVLIDTVSRCITTSEIPLGVLTAIIGAPFFIFLLKKTKGGGWKE